MLVVVFVVVLVVVFETGFAVVFVAGFTVLAVLDTVLAVVVATFAVVAGVAVTAAAGAGAGVGMIELGSVAVGTTAAASTVPLIFNTTGEFLALELTVTLLENGPTLCVS